MLIIETEFAPGKRWSENIKKIHEIDEELDIFFPRLGSFRLKSDSETIIIRKRRPWLPLLRAFDHNGKRVTFGRELRLGDNGNKQLTFENRFSRRTVTLRIII